MSNPMKYIKDLEAAGFERIQAEAQVQMVLDAIEGDLVTKADFAVFQERIENRLVQNEQRFDAKFKQIEQRFDSKFDQLEQRLDAKFDQIEQRFDARIDRVDQRVDAKSVQLEERIERRFIESEFRLLSRIGFLVVSTGTIAVAVLTWLIKI